MWPNLKLAKLTIWVASITAVLLGFGRVIAVTFPLQGSQEVKVKLVDASTNRPIGAKQKAGLTRQKENLAGVFTQELKEGAKKVTSNGGQRADVDGKVSADEYAIYSLIIKEGTRLFVNTSPDFISNFATELQGLLKQEPGLKQSTLSDYEHQNNSAYPLDSRLLKTRVDLVTDGQPGAARENAITKLSRIGFDEEKSQALVHVTYACNPRCANDFYYVLVRDGPGWKLSNPIYLRIWN